MSTYEYLAIYYFFGLILGVSTHNIDIGFKQFFFGLGVSMDTPPFHKAPPLVHVYRLYLFDGNEIEFILYVLEDAIFARM